MTLKDCGGKKFGGRYYLWFQFMVGFGKRIPGVPLYSLFLIPRLAVMALRPIAIASGQTAEAR
jgi:sulfoxide reductase heme-binding subunit YedZ